MTNSVVLTEGTFTPSISFTIAIVDPCRTTVISSIDLSAGITVKSGKISTLEYAMPTDSVEVATNKDTLCGDFAYKIVDHNNNDFVVDWISIAPKANTNNRFIITAKPMFESTATIG